MNAYNPDGSQNSPEAIAAEVARLAAKPEYVDFPRTGLRADTDTDDGQTVTIRSRKGNVLGSISSASYRTLISLVGVEQAHATVASEGQHSVDWEAYIHRLQTIPRHDWKTRRDKQDWPETFDDMLDCIDLCDNIDKLAFKDHRDGYLVRFEFCNIPFEIQAEDEGDGWGAYQSGRVFTFGTTEDVIFWIACELATRLQKPNSAI